MWLIMADMYGHKWTSQHSVEVDKEGVWRKALTGVSPRQFADGLNLVVTGGDEWPPAAPVFRKLCLNGLDTPAQRAFKKKEAAQVPVGRWLPDHNKQERIKAAKEATLKQLRKPSKKLTKEETDAILKSLDR